MTLLAPISGLRRGLQLLPARDHHEPAEDAGLGVERFQRVDRIAAVADEAIGPHRDQPADRRLDVLGAAGSTGSKSSPARRASVGGGQAGARVHGGSFATDTSTPLKFALRARPSQNDGPEPIRMERRVPSTIPQPVAASLTPAAIFLVVTVNDGPQPEAAVRACAATWPASCARSASATSRAGCPASWRSAPTPGTGCSARRGRRNCIRSRKSAASITPSPRRATSSFISAPRAWICASSWRPRSWRGSAAPSPRPTRCTASSTSTIATCSGFVDGTENPVDQAAVDATVIGEEDAAFAGGSYVIVQKYLHDLTGWNAVPVEQQEKIIGRTKLSDIELDDAVKPSFAAQRPDDDRGERRRARDRARQHAVRRGRQGRVRHLFLRLCPLAAPDRADAREHVRRQAARQLRPAAGFQPRRDRHAVLRADRDVSRGRRARGSAFDRD